MNKHLNLMNMKPLDKKDKREKERLKREKLAIRQVCKTTPKEKK